MMRKNLRLLDSKCAKRKTITSNTSFCSFDNSFIDPKEYDKHKDLSVQNMRNVNGEKENEDNTPVNIDEYSPTQISSNCDPEEIIEFDIETDHSSDDGQENRNKIKKTFHLSTVLDFGGDDYGQAQVRPENQKVIKNGYEEKYETLLRRSKSEAAISNYKNRFSKKSDIPKDHDGSEQVEQLIVERSVCSFSFVVVFAKKLSDNGDIILIVTFDQVKEIRPNMVLLVAGIRCTTKYGDTPVWYDIARVSAMSEDEAHRRNHELKPHETLTVSVACDCLSRPVTDKVSLCPNSQRKIPYKKFHGYGYEKKFSQRCILVLKKIQFWYHTIIRYGLIFVRYGTDDVGTIYVPRESFREVSEGCVYVIGNEARLPDSSHIYGSSARETHEYVCHIYGQLPLSSQEKVISFMGNIRHGSVTLPLNHNCNIDGRLCTLKTIQNQLIEYLPSCLNVDNSPDKSRFNLSGIAFCYGVERIEGSKLLKVFLFSRNLQSNIHEVVVTKLCYFPPFAWTKICKLYCVDCYKYKGKLFADQFTRVYMEYINTMSFAKIMLTNVATLDALSEIFSAPSGTVARFQGMDVMTMSTKATVHDVCANCLSVTDQNQMCNNICPRARAGCLHLYEYDTQIRNGATLRDIRFMTRKEPGPMEVMLIIGSDNKQCLILDL